MRRALPVAVALGMLLAGCVPTPEPSVPPATASPPATVSATPSPTASTGTLAWTPCGTGECADLRVPLDHANPGGPHVTLPVKRLRATAEPRLGSLLINPGGPGGSGVSYVTALSRQGLEQFDIVGWDPRGLGGDARVTCLTDAETDAYLALDFSPDTPKERAALAAGARRFGTACAERSGALLAHVSTEDSARDLDLLRAAVGDEKLSFYGASYGTLLGARYAELFPHRVGRMVLDAPTDPTAQPAVGQSLGFERALLGFAQWCAEGSCSWGDTADAVRSDLHAWVDTLDANPVPVGQRRLTQTLAAFGMAAHLYHGPGLYPVLRDAVVAARQGNGQALLTAADGLFGRSSSGQYGPTLAASQAVVCADQPRRSDAEVAALWKRDQAAAPFFGTVLGPEVGCGAWPVPPVPWRVPRAEGAAPILVVGATGDSATPFEWATAMAATLASGRLLTYDGTGHVSYGRHPCVDAAVRSYLTTGELPDEGARCG